MHVTPRRDLMHTAAVVHTREMREMFSGTDLSMGVVKTAAGEWRRIGKGMHISDSWRFYMRRRAK